MENKKIEYAIKFFERHLKEDVLRYGERQAIQIALSVLREQKTLTDSHGLTNGDNIRVMSNQDLAASKYIPCPYDDDGYGECKFGWHDREQTCEECKLEWLQQVCRGTQE